MATRFSGKTLFSLVALCAATALSGCTTKVNALCPNAAGLVEASSLTRFAPGAPQDPSHALFRVDVVGVSTDCTPKMHTVAATVTVNFRATRSPSPRAADYTVPYFVAIHSGALIQAKQVFTVHFHFDPGQSTVSFSDTVDSVLIHVAPDKVSYDYELLAGLQLTRADLDYNRKMGLYGP